MVRNTRRWLRKLSEDGLLAEIAPSLTKQVGIPV